MVPHLSSRLRRSMALVGISVAAHVIVLAVLASIVVLPALYDAPALESASLQPMSSSSVLDYDQSDADALLGLGLDQVDLARLSEAPPAMALTSVALPLPVGAGAAPVSSSPLDAVAMSIYTDQALTDFARPGVGRRGAFVGTVYTFRRIRRVRTDGDWFKGSGKEESGDQVYAYRCLFPGRASGDTAERRTLALDYATDIMWPDALAGLYEFRLASHESAVFQIDGTDVVVQDGSQSFKPLEGRKMITAGRHTLRLAFLQSPAARLGVILQYRRIDGAGWEVFDLRDVLSSAADQAQDPFAPGRGVTKATQ